MESPRSQSTNGLNDFKIKLAFFSNELPNYDLKDLFRRLQRNSKDKRFRFLALFLDEANTVVKEELLNLPQTLQDLVPPFQTVLSLADFRQGPLWGAMESALLCVLEIGMFIAHHEAQDLEYDLHRSGSTLAGLSIGLVAAAAVSISSSLSDIALNGVESVRVSFRLGIHVDGVSQSLECREANSTPESWAYVVTGVSAEEVKREIEQYNKESYNMALTQVFISALDKNSVSVSGPPSRLKSAFRHSQVLRYSKHMPMPVYNGLCHAPHVYSADDVDIIVNGSEPKCNHSRPVLLPLHSADTGLPYQAKDAGSLFTNIVSEILTGTIYLDNLIDGILRSVSSSEKPECRVLLFRTSIISKGILTSLESDLPHVTISMTDLIDWSTQEFPSRIPRSPRESKLAVVGMSCRMPGGANDNELFWKLMMEGRDVHSEVPADRFDLKTHFDPTGKTPNATETPFGNFIDKPGMFDAAFFNMSPKEAEQTDPMHRLALVTAYEALEMSGYSPNRTPSTNKKRIGTFYGQASDDWRELNGAQNISTYAVPGGERAFANGRINYFFKFSGPSFNIDTACSSGLAAVQAGCSALWAGEADTVLAGGLSVITNPDNYCMLGKGHFLSKTGQCKVWDKNADGYCRADGIGSVVIKRLEDAEADNDNIIATILGGATNHSAEAISITHPHADSQKDNYNQVMHGAGGNPLDVSYIELHGTGTQAGDAEESESVADVFAPLVPRRRNDQRLQLGAVKSNIGHGEAAAGIASLIKSLLVYQKGFLPKHVGILSEINPIISKDLEKRNCGLTMENTARPRIEGKKRVQVVNSFGAHGGNTTILLEDAPEKPRIGKDPSTTYPVAISAKGKHSLKGNIEQMLAFLDENPKTDLGDLSYTVCARRIHHNTRIATSASSIAQLQKFLLFSLEKASEARPIPTSPPAVAFAFSGQGAFYKGIGAQLFEHFPNYRQQVIQLDHIAQQFGFPSVIPAVNGTIDDGVSPLITQLTIVVVQIALARFWALLGVRPSAVIGHSLGEYAALVVAGVISAADAIFLVGKRAQLTVATCEIGSHVMLSVRASPEDIEKLSTSKDWYEISCMNGPKDTVISGLRKHIEATRAALESSGVKCTLLDIPFAFHTAQMNPMLESFEETAKHVPFKTPCVPIISPLLNDIVFDGKTVNAKYLSCASREPVNFVGALEAGQDLGVFDDKTIWLDIGPHPICASFIRSCLPEAKVVSSLRKDEDNFATISGGLAILHTEGISVSFNEYFQPHEKAHNLLTLKAYKWNEKNYWIQYVGTWTLDKAFSNGNKKPALGSLTGSSLRTSSVQQIISEDIRDTTGGLTAISDLMHPDLLNAINGHKMNNNGVATSSIWCDIALTLGDYLYKKMVPKAKNIHMNVFNLEVFHAQIAHKDRSIAQLLQMEANIDLPGQQTKIHFYNVDNEGFRSQDAFATVIVKYENLEAWQAEWKRVKHLVTGRIEALDGMAAAGTANKVCRNMAYTLFKNVVDYADRYRGMHSITLNEYEAYADVSLDRDRHGTWNTPPHWIDSIFHLGGFIMNGSDASNTRDFFYVTPGWGSARLGSALAPGKSYRSYVKMSPMAESNMYSGDVYVMQDGEVIGMMGQMKFRQVPRLLMDHFFSPPAATKCASSSSNSGKFAAPKPVAPKPIAPTVANTETAAAPAAASFAEQKKIEAETASAPAEKSSVAADSGPIADVLKLIARETGLEPEELRDEASFVELGVDSLMSLVLSEKFKVELNLEVKSSLFLECPSLADLKEYLEQIV